MPTHPPVVSLLGLSGSGKTTLAEALVRRWTEAGRRVGFVKHASHGFQMDRPGKDTDRVAAAGAAGIAVTGPGGTAYLERGAPEDPARLVDRFFADRDVVVLEGFRSHPFPAVVILSSEEAERVLAEAAGPILAVVAGPGAEAAARGVRGSPPVFAPSDVAGLARHLESSLRLGGGAGA